MDVPKLTWSARQRMYREQLSRLRIPADPTPADLRQVEAGLDAISTNVRFELSEVKAWLERLEEFAKNVRATVSRDLREQGVCKTEKAREELVEIALRSYPVELKLMDEVLPVTYAEALDMLLERKHFLSAVMEECAAKHNRVISHIATVKTEAMLVDEAKPEGVFQRRNEAHARIRKNA